MKFESSVTAVSWIPFEAVKGFLRAFLKGLKDTAKDPVAAIESVRKRNETANKDAELDRLQLALRDNIVTPEVKANGFGGVDMRGSIRRSVRSR